MVASFGKSPRYSAFLNPNLLTSARTSILMARHRPLCPRCGLSLDDPRTFTEYPDIKQTELKESIASYAGIPTQNIAVANGFVPLLEAALRALPIRRCLLPVPAFAEYRKTLERANVEIVPYVLRTESRFSYDPELWLPDSTMLFFWPIRKILRESVTMLM